MIHPLKSALSAITGAETAKIEPGEARNGVLHVVAPPLTKTADAPIAYEGVRAGRKLHLTDIGRGCVPRQPSAPSSCASTHFG